ncbi:MAG: DUF4129 domain-containing protein [Fimbriimonadaceae bacterium]
MKFSFAILVSLGLAQSVAAGPYANLEQRLKGGSPNAVTADARESGLAQKDASLAELLNAHDKTAAERATAVKAYVSMRALFEARHPGTASTPIADIKKSGLYRKADDAGENWVARAIDRIRFNVQLPNQQPTPTLPNADLGFLVYVMWGVLGLLVAAFLFFAIRYFVWQTDRRRGLRSTAMLEDDEPVRTLDEWLELAAQLEAQGRFREAVRCLYVACLLRYDEHRVARFDRTQTNWEHFRRIQASPNNPTEFDLLGRTTDFDHVWYGYRPTNAAEVQRFRDAYTELTSLLTRRLVGSR